ncbi:MAG: hypothetical protein PHE79_11735 [Eubacteriales bacterium]|nr:hypothetical protein [Eubacteriales bacterium]
MHYTSDQIMLLDIYASLDDLYKGMLLERALFLAEESNAEKRKRILNLDGNVVYVNFKKTIGPK